MVFLILESLGSTELMFILVMALVFFGPRKLPQLSRTLGKNLASFRRASEDFKRTWEKEVNLEELNLSRIDLDSGLPERSILDAKLDATEASQPLAAVPPVIEQVEEGQAVPRQAESVESPDAFSSSHPNPVESPEPPLKRDWL